MNGIWKRDDWKRNTQLESNVWRIPELAMEVFLAGKTYGHGVCCIAMFDFRMVNLRHPLIYPFGKLI
jgi:hypothetical protein